MSPYEVQFLRFLVGLVVMMPWLLASGFAAYRPNGLGGSLFAASLLITKVLTRRDRAEVIVVWQAITISLCSPCRSR